MAYETKLRTHTCNDLKKEDIDKEVKLTGWVSTRRDHGGVIFIDLRDRFGLTQVTINPEPKEVFVIAEKLRREDCIQILGKVRVRPEGMNNPNMDTGEIEVLVLELNLLNKSEVPPIEVEDRSEANEELRLQYRFLDLRRPIMQKRLSVRHKASLAAFQYLDANGFRFIETPVLVKSTPEGARDYVVPSRVNPGKFYALPQSPQLYKQMLMVSGCDRYFQFARCLRDEDLRADRQPEHTQIDLEMSFVELEDIYSMVEGLMAKMFKDAIGVDIKIPFARLPYQESINRFGIDKPDLRFGLELIDVGDIVKKSEFSVFKDAIENAGQVKCINPEKEFSRKELDELIKFCQQAGAKGMAYIKVTDNGLESSIVKFFSEELQKELVKVTKAKPGSTLLFIADKPTVVSDVLARLRNELGKRLELYDPKKFNFAWITQFPLFEWDEAENKWIPCHHMFCKPTEETIEFLETDPGKVICTQFDITLNGVELASGSLRINQPELQERVLKVIGIEKKEAEEKFGFLMNSFKYGAPPHGGIGLGFDRIAALMNGTNDIREVMSFPKNKNAQSPLDGCPDDISELQKKELFIESTVKKEKK